MSTLNDFFDKIGDEGYCDVCMYSEECNLKIVYKGRGCANRNIFPKDVI